MNTTARATIQAQAFLSDAHSRFAVDLHIRDVPANDVIPVQRVRSIARTRDVNLQVLDLHEVSSRSGIANDKRSARARILERATARTVTLIRTPARAVPVSASPDLCA